MLGAARRPLVFGLGGVPTEAQRVAVALADRLGGVADWTTAAANANAMIAFQTVGAVGASYGEAAERADLVVCWGCPAEPLPGFDKIGDPSRGAIEVGGPDLPLRPGADYEALHTLRALLAGVDLDPQAVRQATGVPLDDWRRLLERITAASYVVIVRGPGLAAGGHAAVAALTQFGQELHRATRVAIASPPAEANRLGAENVLAWQTGYPLAVCFAAGYPRYGPGEFDAQTLLERGEADAAFVVDDAESAHLSEAARRRLRSIPRVVFSHRLSHHDGVDGAEVCFRTEPLSQSKGTFYRADGMALTLPGEAAAAEAALRLILQELNHP